MQQQLLADYDNNDNKKYSDFQNFSHFETEDVFWKPHQTSQEMDFHAKLLNIYIIKNAFRP